jgi:AraC-like DNA-binding protein
MGAEPADEALVRLPRPAAARAVVPDMVGYRTAAMPGIHRGLPSPWLTLVFSLSGSLPINVPAGSEVRAGSFRIPLGGLHTRAVLLPRRLPHAPTAPQRGIQLAVHPLAARAMFGVPASALTDEVLEVEEVVGAATALRDRLDAGPAGANAAALVGRWLDARIRASSPPAPPPELAQAWRLIVGSAGRARIGDVAREVGWSRRHLTTRMRAEIGVGAKDLARLARFRRSRVLMGRQAGSLGQIAGDSGYADQSHLTAEWREFAGCTPGQWIASELTALSSPG